VKMID